MMGSGPPKTLEAFVAIVIPPACREEVLGDLHERYTSAAQYGLDAATTVPLVILSRIHRTANSRALLIQAFAFYLSFLFAAWLNAAALLRAEYGLLRLAIPAAAAMLGVMLADAYASPGRPQLKLALGPGVGAGLALVSQGLAWLVSPDFAVPRLILFFGCSAGLFLSLAVRILFSPAAGQGAKDKDDYMKLLNAKAAIMGVILVCVAAVLWVSAGKHPAEAKLTYSQFLASVESGRISSVTILGSNSGTVTALCRLADGNTARTVLPADYRDALRTLQDKQVNIEIRDSSSEPLRLLVNSIPFLVLMAFWLFMMQRLRKDPRQRLLG